MLLIMIPDQYPNYYKVLESYTGCFDSLNIMILFSYPSSIVITRDYCMSFRYNKFHVDDYVSSQCSPVVDGHCAESNVWPELDYDTWFPVCGEPDQTTRLLCYQSPRRTHCMPGRTHNTLYPWKNAHTIHCFPKEHT